jgi:hypothetical protein
VSLDILAGIILGMALALLAIAITNAVAFCARYRRDQQRRL